MFSAFWRNAFTGLIGLCSHVLARNVVCLKFTKESNNRILVDMLLSIKFVFSTTTKKVILTYLYFKLLSSGRIHHFSSELIIFHFTNIWNIHSFLFSSLEPVFFVNKGSACHRAPKIAAWQMCKDMELITVDGYVFQHSSMTPRIRSLKENHKKKVYKTCATLSTNHMPS